mgnify:CR=1 FL=1
MTTYEHAPSLAYIIQREAQALINAINDGDDYDTAGTLATIAEIIHRMQLGLDPELVANTCPGDWTYNGHPVYPKHYRLNSTGHVTSLTPVGKTEEETA